MGEQENVLMIGAFLANSSYSINSMCGDLVFEFSVVLYPGISWYVNVLVLRKCVEETDGINRFFFFFLQCYSRYVVLCSYLNERQQEKVLIGSEMAGAGSDTCDDCCFKKQIRSTDREGSDACLTKQAETEAPKKQLAVNDCKTHNQRT